MSDGKQGQASSHGEGDLLYGILAMQMDFISREDLIAAVSAWVRDKSIPLSQVLLDRNMIDSALHDILQSLVHKHLECHDHDARRSLASLSSIGSLREELGSIQDADVEASLDHVAALDSDARTAETMSTGPIEISPDGRYRVLRPHARGGLGEVFVAHDNELHRDVALKQIKKEHVHEVNSRSRFTMEAEITGRLEHPGVVPVYGLGTDASGCPFYVMRFIQGDSLKEAVERFHHPVSAAGRNEVPGRGSVSQRHLAGNVQFRQLLGRFVDVCDAIQYAHSRGVLHRDLKPGNIMLGRYGETLVVDWGLAKLLGHRSDSSDSKEATLHSATGSGSSITQMGQTVGTPQYMSPEQAAGRLDAVGTAADVYSLGATLYSVLTGQAPFPEPGQIGTGEVLRKVQRGEFPAPRSVQRCVPPALDAICMKAMALEPADRYASPRELADEVERWLADAAVQAYRSPMYRTRLWCKRHRSAVAVASLLLAILVGALGFWSARRSRIHDQLARHIEQAGLLVAAGDHHAASTQVAIAESLAQDEFAGRDCDEQVSHWRNQLSAYQQFLQKSETARDYVWAGTKSFGDQWNPVSEDLTSQKCREALDVYGVLSNPDWQQGMSNRVLTEDQRARVNREAEELLVLLALRTAVGAGNDQQGNEKRREALAILEVAERCGTLGPGVSSLRMLWYRALGEDEKADAAGDRGVELAKTGGDPGDVIDRYVLAQIVHVILDRPGDAIPLYERVLKLQPDHVRSHQALFDCYYELSDVAGQRRHLEVCIALRPANPMFNYFRGMTYFADQDYRRASDDFDAAIQKDKDFALGYFYRGRMHVVDGGWESAERDFSAALNVDHGNHSAYLWRAVARGKLGRYEQAAADAELALELQEDDALSHYYAARAYAQAAGAASADVRNRPKSTELAESYRQKAVQLLKRGIELGFDDFSRVVPGGDFTPVCASEEFRRLVLDTLAERIEKREAELAEEVADLKQRLQLAEWYLAEIELRTGFEPPKDADIQQLDKALSLLRELVKEGGPSIVTSISRVLQRKAELLDRLDKADEAAKTWQMMAVVDKLSPTGLAIYRARNLAKWGSHARAWELLAGHLESSEMRGGSCYRAACVLALAANTAADDLELDGQSRARLVREYSDRAVGLLQRAVEQDYFQKESARLALRHNPELDAIRDHSEFQKLLAETKETASERENTKQAEKSR